MTRISRRRLLAATGALGAMKLVHSEFVLARPVKDRLNIAIIGCGGRAKSLKAEFQNIAELTWLCDPDKKRLDQFADPLTVKNRTTDLREVLADSKVDAVVIATPDHWHAPAAIMACEAKKHVYVEKPCSHNLKEGQLLVGAARKNQVVVQHGTQSRTNPMIANAIQLLKEGTIGEILMAKAWNVQRRNNIGKSNASSPPSHVDYDTWVGPAEYLPYQENRFHYNWHWWHNFGTGDIGNDGAHEMDIARWGLGVEGLPSLVTATGGKYYFDDDQQFPDNAMCTFEWPGKGGVGDRKQLVFEMRIWSKNYPYNCDTGVEFYGTRGMLMVSKRGKLMVWNDDNKQIEPPKPKEELKLESSHQSDFIQAILSNRKPNADIEIGHHSVALIHLANIAIRTGRSLRIDPLTESILSDNESNFYCGRVYRKEGHWSIPKQS